MNLTRRHALAGLAASSLLAMTPLSARAMLSPVRQHLALRNLHTGERFAGTYRDSGGYVDTAIEDLNHVLRDHRSGEVYTIDPALFDWMVSLRDRLGGDEFHIISGYRSPNTNAAMRRQGRGVAKRSYHMKGQAIDLRLPGVATLDLRERAREDGLGGVGYYARSDFVHLDTGRVRFW